MMRRASVAVVVLFVASTLGAGAAGKRPITDTDLFKFTWIADPQISPDGSTVAFVRVTVNEKENRYESSIFTVPASGGRSDRSTGSPSAGPEIHRLTSGIRDTAPRWSPDGRRLAS